MDNNNMTPALERFRRKIESYSPITDVNFQELAAVVHEKHFGKGEVILKEGQVCKHFYFILSGCIRGFCLEKGREVNVNFYFEDETASDFMSLREEKPSQCFLIAMEDCDVISAAKTAYLPIFNNAGAWQTVLFRFFQELYFKEEEHSNSFKLLSPEERYQYVLDHQPAYLQRIPLVHLASYLGMSRETLTRIRKKIS